MPITGKVFAERKPSPWRKRSIVKQEDAPVSIGDFTEFGTLPQETITRLGLQHVYTLPTVLEDGSTTQVLIYRVEVFKRRWWRTVYVQESVDKVN